MQLLPRPLHGARIAKRQAGARLRYRGSYARRQSLQAADGEPVAGVGEGVGGGRGAEFRGSLTKSKLD